MLVFNSLSKRSSMTGYRCGFAAGDPELVATLRAFRPTVGTAPQEFVQRAAIAAWDDESHVERNRERYREQRELLLDALGQRRAAGRGQRGGDLPVGRGAGAASRRRRSPTACSSAASSSRPAPYFGPSGEGYVRIALTPPLDECRRAAEILGGAVTLAERIDELWESGEPEAEPVEEAIRAARLRRGARRRAARRRAG